jgi:hypothetical protein
MERAVGLVVVVFLATGCQRAADYERAATEFVQRGPVVCCSEGGEARASNECLLAAAKTCAYAKDAVLTTKSIADVPNGGTSTRSVTIDLSGPNGRGRCVVRVVARAQHIGSGPPVGVESAKCQAL